MSDREFFLVDHDPVLFINEKANDGVNVKIKIVNFPVSYECVAEKMIDSALKSLNSMLKWLRENVDEKLFKLKTTIKTKEGMEAYFFNELVYNAFFDCQSFHRINFYDPKKTGSCSFKWPAWESGKVQLNCEMPLDQLQELFDIWKEFQMKIKEECGSPSGIPFMDSARRV